MAPTTHLALINLFTGDIQGGLEPFPGTWLAEAGSWSPARVGLVTTPVGFGVLLLSGPFGALVGRVGRPRLLIAAACAAILAGTLLLLPARTFGFGFTAQFLAAAGEISDCPEPHHPAPVARPAAMRSGLKTDERR
ncbi:hypothetical protein MPOCJGCO_3586 [Methylobacterium trifolii]|uniref:MFS transporter n=1 Tax=Methylobacterium trifolii TaxID=1003092 RepID=A0ABQ4U2P8_9HYPH|nr:hypothetical protein MPOCJGCO_3586 [Methylobacterium trifolii]